MEGSYLIGIYFKLSLDIFMKVRVVRLVHSPCQAHSSGLSYWERGLATKRDIIHSSGYGGYNPLKALLYVACRAIGGPFGRTSIG